MKLSVITFCLAVIMTLSVSARGLEGDWHGTLAIGPSSLRIAFKIQPSDATPVTMDSPDQGASGLPGKITYISTDSVSLEFPMLKASYQGTLIDGKLKGTFFQGGYSLPLEMLPGRFDVIRSQTPQPPFPYVEEEVKVVNPDVEGVTLAGTLTIPDGASSMTPIVVFVSGSGLQNRDEELFGHKPFAVMADFLARAGIASFRYDDRGFGESTGDYRTAVTADFASDAAAAIKAMRKMGRFGKTGVLGHSEGAQIAFMLASDGKTCPDFIVGMGTPSMRGDSVLVGQTEVALRQGGLPKEMTESHILALRSVYQSLVSGDTAKAREVAAAQVKLSSDNPPLRALAESLTKIIETSNPWLRTFYSYSPENDIKTVGCPAFAIYGSLDSQVLPENYERIRQINPGIEAKLYPGLNHMMQHATTGSVQDYNAIEETISPEVLKDIEDFIKKQY